MGKNTGTVGRAGRTAILKHDAHGEHGESSKNALEQSQKPLSVILFVPPVASVFHTSSSELSMVYVWIILGLVVLIIAGIALFVLIMGHVGRSIPEEHEATSVIEIHATVQKVFDAIADIEKHPEWAVGVSQVFVLPEQNGMQAARMRMGRNSFVLVRTKFQPPDLLERSITDDHGPFSGTWLYRVKDVSRSGETLTEVRLKENGKVTWPAARAMMKYFFGYHAYTHRHLRSLAGKFEPNPAPAHRA
jgi:uncharacterized protein YndB with AHSA1/START domain